MNFRKKIYLTLLISLIVIFGNILITKTSFGADDNYHTLAPIGNFVTGVVDTGNLNNYLNKMFQLGIAIAAGLAVVMIIVGGIEYMSSDAIGKKSDGKKRITAAIVGLIVALGSYMLLNTLSPDLLKTDLGLHDLNIASIHSDDGVEYTGNGSDRDQGNYVNTGPYPPPSGDLNNYLQSGCVPDTDHTDHQGLIDPNIAYLRDLVPSQFGNSVMSTYRSPEHNRAVGGAEHSAHVQGEAIDFGGTGGNQITQSQGDALAEWAKQNGQQYGLKQIIWHGTLCNSPDGGASWECHTGNYDHDDHVHLGRGGTCFEGGNS